MCETASHMYAHTCSARAKVLLELLVLGEVVGIHIAPHLIADGAYRTAAAHPILRGGGAADYFEIGEAARFAMRRPD